MPKLPKPDNIPWITPSLTVRDIPRSMKFYQQAFGFDIGMSMPDDSGEIAYADMQYKGAMAAMLMRRGSWGSDIPTPKDAQLASPVSLYVYCDDVDALFAQAKAAGATIASEPEDQFWGDRTASFTDPDGHSWNFATRVKEMQQPPAQTQTA